ncbi:hypothetical protein T439DRAFT_320095 [Meredithblackwellia eburnea MCA 4105]
MNLLRPQQYAAQISDLVNYQDGVNLARLFDLADNHRDPLWRGLLPSDQQPPSGRQPAYETAYRGKLGDFGKKKDEPARPWLEMAAGHTAVICLIKLGTDFSIQAFERQHEIVNTFYRWLIDALHKEPNGWAKHVLYAVCRDLKTLAIQADNEQVRQQLKPSRLEQASRLFQKCFAACLTDRNPDVQASRKMGTYYMACLLFKTYFKLKSTALCKNIIRGITASDLQPLAFYPKAHQVTFNYYLGVFAFLREDYVEAEAKLQMCIEMVPRRAPANIHKILNYLIPLMLYRGVLPSRQLLESSIYHSNLFGGFFQAFKTGNLRMYDFELADKEKILMSHGTYLIIERSREGCVRALLKKAWIFENKPARMAISSFTNVYNQASLTLCQSERNEAERLRAKLKEQGKSLEEIKAQVLSLEMKAEKLDSEEMECVLTNMIYKNLLKGYIAHGPQVVVLSKDRPFPWYPPVTALRADQKAQRDASEVAERQKPVPPLVLRV